jgi:hypothetical protein
MSAKFIPFIICKLEGNGIQSFPIDTADGRRALPVFTSAAKARDFLASKGAPEEGGEAREMGFEEFRDWLGYHLTNGVPLVTFDPQERGFQTVPIFRILAELAKYTQFA